MSIQMETFSFNPPISLSEEGKWLLAVTSSNSTNSVFTLNNRNNSFSITIPGQRILDGSEDMVDELNRLIKLRSENNNELQINEFEKRCLVLEMLGPDPKTPKKVIRICAHV